ncbi:DDE-type integrase/transposase/recombinase [Oceanobacillus damuensis]|uniref:DDE-type integrase/transposase/recombinase n=1 Tax=Oceanobacillus damuensis TaxID=937928 RepID=UPI00389966FC
MFKKKRKFKYEEQVAENVLQRNFTADKPDDKYVTDITYLTGNRTRLYLSTILDVCTKEAVAYQISEVNDNKVVIDTLKKLKKKRDVKTP